jgi:hypothetical protein
MERDAQRKGAQDSFFTVEQRMNSKPGWPQL